MSRLLMLCFAALLVLPPITLAQDTTEDFTLYGWESGDLALRYPATWEAPAAGLLDGREALLLAPINAATPAQRPPENPYIHLVIVPDVSDVTNLYALLEARLRADGILAQGPLPAALLGASAFATRGSNPDALLYGMGRVLRYTDEQALLIYGRVAAEEQAAFATTFNAVADSLVPGATSVAGSPDYGVLWHTERFATDGPEAFVAIGALALHEDGVYIADAVVGVVQLAEDTGQVQAIIPFEDFSVSPQAMVIAPDGSIYVADTVCQCVRVWQNGAWRASLGGFGFDAPQSLALTPDGTLYATDSHDAGVFVRAFALDARTPAAQQPFAAAQTTQPHLAVDSAGRLLALATDGVLYRLADEVNQADQENAEFAPIAELAIAPPEVNALAVDAEGNLLLATARQGVMRLDASGVVRNRIGRIVPGFPLPGELVSPQGVAVDAQGTVYWADSDGVFGNVTAMSLAVQPGRVGRMQLRAGLPVGGTLDAALPQQAWVFSAEVGQRVVLTAQAATDTPELDVSLRLQTQDGTEIASNDNHDTLLLLNPFDALLTLTLPQTSEYAVIVTAMAGTGRYTLGFGLSQALPLAAGRADVRGDIRDEIPLQSYAFTGQAGQRLTATLLAEGGTLDPLLRLLGPDGALLAENDDADDGTLGRNAQLVQVVLPAAGVYLLEATRFDGEGGYSLQVILE